MLAFILYKKTQKVRSQYGLLSTEAMVIFKISLKLPQYSGENCDTQYQVTKEHKMETASKQG